MIELLKYSYSWEVELASEEFDPKPCDSGDLVMLNSLELDLEEFDSDNNSEDSMIELSTYSDSSEVELASEEFDPKPSDSEDLVMLNSLELDLEEFDSDNNLEDSMIELSKYSDSWEVELASEEFNPKPSDSENLVMLNSLESDSEKFDFEPCHSVSSISSDSDSPGSDSSDELAELCCLFCHLYSGRHLSPAGLEASLHSRPLGQFLSLVQP